MDFVSLQALITQLTTTLANAAVPTLSAGASILGAKMAAAAAGGANVSTATSAALELLELTGIAVIHHNKANATKPVPSYLSDAFQRLSHFEKSSTLPGGKLGSDVHQAVDGFFANFPRDPKQEQAFNWNHATGKGTVVSAHGMAGLGENPILAALCAIHGIDPKSAMVVGTKVGMPAGNGLLPFPGQDRVHIAGLDKEGRQKVIESPLLTAAVREGIPINEIGHHNPMHVRHGKEVETTFIHRGGSTIAITESRDVAGKEKALKGSPEKVNHTLENRYIAALGATDAHSDLKQVEVDKEHIVEVQDPKGRSFGRTFDHARETEKRDALRETPHETKAPEKPAPAAVAAKPVAPSKPGPKKPDFSYDGPGM